MPLAAEKISDRIGATGTLDVQQNLTPDERCEAHGLFMVYGDYAKEFKAEEWIDSTGRCAVRQSMPSTLSLYDLGKPLERIQPREMDVTIC